VGDCGVGPIIPPGIIPPGFICSPGFIWAPGAIIAPGFICSPGFIWLQQSIGLGLGCSLQLRKNPEKKIPATMNKPPATMPTHAKAWFRRLGWGREFLCCSVAMSASSAGGGTSVGLVMVYASCLGWVDLPQCYPTLGGVG
jgi:hypothetical protein